MGIEWCLIDLYSNSICYKMLTVMNYIHNE